MHDTIRAALADWANFYLITGTAAAALTGLQFIVQTLLATDAMHAVQSGDPEAGIAAFGTPTVVHFSLALVISALACAPWSSYAALRVMMALVGAGALVYAAIVLWRTRRQDAYATTAYDWFWYTVMPGAAYIAVLVTPLLGVSAEATLGVLAGATLLLLCVGIHNAWDTVTYLTVAAVRRSRAQ